MRVSLSNPLPIPGFLAGREFFFLCVFSEIMLTSGHMHLLVEVNDSYSKNEEIVKESLM